MLEGAPLSVVWDWEEPFARRTAPYPMDPIHRLRLVSSRTLSQVVLRETGSFGRGTSRQVVRSVDSTMLVADAIQTRPECPLER